MDDVSTLFEFYICTITSDTNMKMEFCDVFLQSIKKPSSLTDIVSYLTSVKCIVVYSYFLSSHLGQ